MSSLKPLKLYHKGAVRPNPWKVVAILEELDLPYELVKVEDIKGKEYLAINPNGRVPALVDPNTSVTTWESGSKIDHFIETYDQDHKISFGTSPEKFLARNWAHFQMSGQGPYFGQKAWFSRYHPETVQSAIDRYGNEIERILGVIELHLATTGQQYLVGNRVSYADLMFVSWNDLLPLLKGADFDYKGKFPKTFEWNERLATRESVQKTRAGKSKAMAA
ncbi:hypothetical protein M409DRAFT_22359 [Zasmidium cellare ATCC 36951]|uniref:GST N-terminal domain-containing protein n=1 Tax=Zasmidium cellare ATCC 36951 TaxID=1080233 RepID=A0A6A6CK01_ZASCE|nr:uncharacterized protein M409DRAFT_22359 [Zasmidium cellare ATCC 36951]KAF2167554.1 hypothetical protein M409DRAFT_22359 [Zasmidium cellare ATCC 36951]